MIVLKGPRGGTREVCPGAISSETRGIFEDQESLGERRRTIIVLHHSYRTTYGIAVPQPCVLAKSGPDHAPNPYDLLRLPNLPLTAKTSAALGRCNAKEHKAIGVLTAKG